VLLEELTPSQREAVLHPSGPLLIIAGAGTGKTTVITRRIAWLIASKRAHPKEILALTFTEKAAAEMEQRVDLLVPYGYTEVAIRTFHAFGDELLRDHALKVGLDPQFRVLSKAEQLVFLRQRAFDLPLERLRPPHDPTRYLEAFATLCARAKDEAVTPEEFRAFAQSVSEQTGDDAQAAFVRELAGAYAAYQQLLREAQVVDFGDQVLLAVQLLEHEPDVRAALQQRYRYLLVDEFQDTNFAQFRLLQLLATPTANVTVVADDDQSIYKWRGAAISNVLKFLEHYASVRTVVLTENFRSGQPILDCAYRLIRWNDPDRLEVRKGIDKRLIATAAHGGHAPQFHVFDTASSEADWVARTIRDAVESGSRRPSDVAILVRSNRDADLFLRALNVAGLPWHFSGASGLFSRAESKLLTACLKTLADPDDSVSWYHVASSPLYRFAMEDLSKVLACASRTHMSLRSVLERLRDDPGLLEVSARGRHEAGALLSDVSSLLESSRVRSGGQLLYQWLSDRGYLSRLGQAQHPETDFALRIVARFFDQLRRVEELVGPGLAELIQHLELFQAIGQEAREDDDPWADQVNVLTIHKAKGLEFPVVFLVGLIQGRFPTPQRRDRLELPDPLIKDLLPAGDFHLQEERRLFYVGMTRAKQELHLTAAYDYGGKTLRKVSQFVLEALDLASPSPPAKMATARELIERARTQPPVAAPHPTGQPEMVRLDPHGVDDYLTCPLKYRYSHILRIPVMRHHMVVYGAALHKAVEAFFKRRLQGASMTEEELMRVFERSWSSEGFLTREHEEQRLDQGRQTLRRFYASQQTHPEFPTLIEEKFTFPFEGCLVAGRWDRVDQQGEEAVIIDYKSSDIHNQASADKRTRTSVQMQIYALAWWVLRGQLPSRVELRFLETEITGQARFLPEDLEQAKTHLRTVASGIRSAAFQAQPDEHSCRWCAFSSICPFAFQDAASPGL